MVYTPNKHLASLFIREKMRGSSTPSYPGLPSLPVKVHLNLIPPLPKQLEPMRPTIALVTAAIHAYCFPSGVSVGYDVYGVFDGHGGKQAAVFASKHVLPLLQEELADTSVKTDIIVPEGLEGYNQLSEEDKLAWQAQDALVQQIPAALVATFHKVQQQFHEHTQVC